MAVDDALSLPKLSHTANWDLAAGDAVAAEAAAVATELAGASLSARACPRAFECRLLFARFVLCARAFPVTDAAWALSCAQSLIDLM